MNNLSLLQPGESGVIKHVVAEESLLHRLNAMGFRAGKKIELIRRASFNGPLQVRIGSTDIIMRNSEASHIQLQTV